MKCSFFCTYESRFESLVVLWRGRVYGGNCKMSPLPRFQILNILDCWFSEACGL